MSKIKWAQFCLPSCVGCLPCARGGFGPPTLRAGFLLRLRSLCFPQHPDRFPASGNNCFPLSLQVVSLLSRSNRFPGVPVLFPFLRFRIVSPWPSRLFPLLLSPPLCVGPYSLRFSFPECGTYNRQGEYLEPFGYT